VAEWPVPELPRNQHFIFGDVPSSGGTYTTISISSAKSGCRGRRADFDAAMRAPTRTPVAGTPTRAQIGATDLDAMRIERGKTLTPRRAPATFGHCYHPMPTQRAAAYRPATTWISIRTQTYREKKARPRPWKHSPSSLDAGGYPLLRAYGFLNRQSTRIRRMVSGFCCAMEKCANNLAQTGRIYLPAWEAGTNHSTARCKYPPRLRQSSKAYHFGAHGG